jgi:hypothetical protein
MGNDVAAALTEAIATMDRSHVRQDNDAYRAASARAFTIATALIGARTLKDVHERVTRM